MTICFAFLGLLLQPTGGNVQPDWPCYEPDVVAVSAPSAVPDTWSIPGPHVVTLARRG